MSFARGLMVVLASAALAACESTGNDGDVTFGSFQSGVLPDGVANIWIDPDGCQHWYIDDGIEGYMSPRLNRDGTPKCQDTRGSIILKDGSTIPAEQEPVNS